MAPRRAAKGASPAPTRAMPVAAPRNSSCRRVGPSVVMAIASRSEVPISAILQPGEAREQRACGPWRPSPEARIEAMAERAIPVLVSPS
jgi:hypothetical protein